jgi:hypothetical protein
LLVFCVVPVYIIETWWAEDSIFGKKLHDGDWVARTGGDASDGVMVLYDVGEVADWRCEFDEVAQRYQRIKE